MKSEKDPIHAGKRRFLRNAAASTAGLTALSMFPPAIRRALAIPANNRTGTINDVEHVVILMQENRSFDMYFGTFKGVRGFGDRITIPLAQNRSVWEQTNGTRVVMPYHLDSTQGNAQRVSGTPHDYVDAQMAWDGGRMNQWPRYKQNQSMGYYRQKEVDFQFALAEAFTLCDAYHCSTHGGTNTNRLFHWTGTNDPLAQGNGPSTRNQWDSLGASTTGWTWTTYPERLQKAGVSWTVYQNLPENFGDNPLAGFQQYRRANEQAGNSATARRTRPGPPAWMRPIRCTRARPTPCLTAASCKPCATTSTTAGCRRCRGSWRPPRIPNTPARPSPVQGAWYIQETLDALTSNPDVWSKTVLLINFDENDGYFDHVPPPAAPSLNPDGSMAGASTVNTDLERHTHASAQDAADNRVYGPVRACRCTWCRRGARRLGQFPGVRPHVRAAFPGSPLRREGREHQPVAPRRAGRHDLCVQLRHPQRREAAQPESADARRIGPETHRAGSPDRRAAAGSQHPGQAGTGSGPPLFARLAVRICTPAGAASQHGQYVAGVLQHGQAGGGVPRL